jgi:hypothetical protein
MRVRFILRGFLTISTGVFLGIVIFALMFPAQFVQGLTWGTTSIPSTPPPPLIMAPSGELPEGVVGLGLWAQDRGSGYEPAWASGFLLELEDGRVIGLTAAHNLFQGNPDRSLERIGLAVNGRSDLILDAETYFGPPGVPFEEQDFSADYVLLQADQADPAFILQPDERGLPQPGERITLFSGLGGGHGNPRPWQGTVLSADSKAVMLLMDWGRWNPAGMSGSPVISQHTGKVVGMTIAAGLRRTRWMIGINPIGNLVQRAQAAQEFPKISEFHR